MYLAAVSGGADSIAMLAALAVICPAERRAVRCLHVEHGIRSPKESRGDAGYVRQFCKNLGIPCRIVTIPRGKIAEAAAAKGIGIEAAARLYRHGALAREARRLEAGGKTVRILIAHTHSDKLETALMRMLRGAGPAGLAAMPRSRGRILRPLLSFERGDIAEYLREKKLQWREDASNLDEQFLRNRIRHSLVPLLNEKFPGWRASLDSLSETQSLAAAFIREESLRRVLWHTDAEGACCTDADNFFSQPAIIREEALFQGMDLCVEKIRSEELGIRSKLLSGGIPHSSFLIPHSIKRAVVRHFCSGQQKTADFGQVRALCIDGRIRLIISGKEHFESGFSLLIKEPGLYTLKGVSVEVKPGLNSGAAAEGSFSVRLPAALRRCMKEDCLFTGKKKISAAKEFSAQYRKSLISLVDQGGVQAFIHPDEPRLWTRQQSDGTQGQFTVTIKQNTGSKNAE